MHIIGIIIIGFLAGVVAKLLMPGRDPGGFIVTTLLGIVGAFVATYLGQAIGWSMRAQVLSAPWWAPSFCWRSTIS